LEALCHIIIDMDNGIQHHLDENHSTLVRSFEIFKASADLYIQVGSNEVAG